MLRMEEDGVHLNVTAVVAVNSYTVELSVLVTA